MFGGFQVGAFQLDFQQGTATVSDAGRRTRPRPRQYIVKIDGQEFYCRTVDEALNLLRRAREAAELFSVQQAEKAAERLVAAPIEAQLPKLVTPKIQANTRELRAEVSKTKREITNIYRKALIDSEIRLYFALEQRIEDEQEDSILLLM